MKPNKLYIGEYHRKEGAESTIITWKEILAFIGGVFFVGLFSVIVFNYVDQSLPEHTSSSKHVIQQPSGNIEMIAYPKYYRVQYDKTGSIYYEGTTENGTKMRIYID